MNRIKLNSTVRWRGLRCRVLELLDIEGRAAAHISCYLGQAYAWVDELEPLRSRDVVVDAE